MRLLCVWRQRALSCHAVLGQSPPPGSPLERHLLRCASCRRCWEELSSLSATLSSADTRLPPLGYAVASNPSTSERVARMTRAVGTSSR